jgi:FMN-dependent NADH-azoreductase
VATLLHVDSSPLYERSISRQLSGAFVERWKSNHPGATVIEGRTPEQNKLLILSDTLLAELDRADQYVIGVPMHNFGVPSVLKLWIDQISRVGKTFSYDNGTPKGLLVGKKATFIIATGGVYDAQTQMASFNFVEPYLRSVFGFLGVTDATFLTAGGTAALNYGQDRGAFLAPHLEAVQSHAQSI